MKNKINIKKLIKQYLKGITVQNLTKIFNCSSNKIRNILKKNNIPIRNLSESHLRLNKRIKTNCYYCKTNIIKLLCNYNQSKHHFCNSKCFYLYNCGKHNGRYIDGRSYLEQSIWKLAIYKIWRKTILNRDNYTCQICNKKGVYLEVHHKIPVIHIVELFQLINITEVIECKFLWDINNGITLCKKCHNQVHPEKGIK